MLRVLFGTLSTFFLIQSAELWGARILYFRLTWVATLLGEASVFLTLVFITFELIRFQKACGHHADPSIVDSTSRTQEVSPL
jgi:hypothetical protein